MLNLSQIQSFVALADAGSFQEAAERLQCSQPHISQQMRRLEEQLGVRLVMRNRARSVLTRDGEAFLPHARSLLQSATRVEEKLRGRSLVIAASSNIGVFLTPPLISSFSAERNPKPEIRLQIATNRAAIDQALSGEADIALTEWSEEIQGFEWLPWRREKLVAIVSPRHPFATRARVSKAALLNETFIGGEPGTGTGRVLRTLFGAAADKLKIGLDLGSTAAVKEAVKANLGISIVLESSVREDRAYGSLRVVEIEEADIFKTLYALLPRETPDTSLARAFAEYICG